MLIWRHQFASLVVREQNRMWGFKFGKREENISKYVAAIVGFGFLAVGILDAFGLLHWRVGSF